MRKRSYQQHQERVHEYLARLIATLLLLSMGWGALHVWRWLIAWFW